MIKRKTLKVVLSWFGLLIAVVGSFILYCYPGSGQYWLIPLVVGVAIWRISYFILPFRRGDRISFWIDNIEIKEGVIQEIDREGKRVKVAIVGSRVQRWIPIYKIACIF